MLLNSASLQTLYVGFNAAFQRGLGMAAPQHELIATRVNSTTRTNEYGWLGKTPGLREWIGDRVVHNLQAHRYAITNKDFELTVGVDRNDIEDDNLGIYTPMFEEMGQSVAAHPSQLCFGLLAAGFATACYDGQYFFDTDHPVLDETGAPQSVSNTGGGSGTAWYLLALNRPLKPIIRQVRKDYMMTRKDDPKDDNVFNRREFLYGVDGRENVGFGLWQIAYASKQTLDAAAYAAARAAMQGMTGDYGRPLGIRPTHLVVPPSLEAAGLEILNAERDTAGATNVWRGTATLEVVPWLA